MIPENTNCIGFINRSTDVGVSRTVLSSTERKNNKNNQQHRVCLQRDRRSQFDENENDQNDESTVRQIDFAQTEHDIRLSDLDLERKRLEAMISEEESQLEKDLIMLDEVRPWLGF